jgi:hypothetical protein
MPNSKEKFVSFTFLKLWKKFTFFRLIYISIYRVCLMGHLKVLSLTKRATFFNDTEGGVSLWRTLL